MKVQHSVYGSGVVTDISDSHIQIQFSCGMKKFQFPKVFEKFLTTDDAVLLKKIKEAKSKTSYSSVAEKKKSTDMVEGITDTTNRKSYVQKRQNSMNLSNRGCNSLVGDRAQTIPVNSEAEMFELVGYMAKAGRVNSIEAEVPKDGRDAIFERLFPGQKYRPIEMGDTPSGMPNKLSPQFRINFGNLRNCPRILMNNMGKGNGSCVGRINKSKFVLSMVQEYGFKFGECQDINRIRKIAIQSGYEEEFLNGYNR